ncbi:hypothetical protein HanIR_Chr01g0029601 [Helianthus annuus]|nr:hypothetical protein HanIR_Chr01g0029601 [Helianthus annuus]
MFFFYLLVVRCCSCYWPIYGFYKLNVHLLTQQRLITVSVWLVSERNLEEGGSQTG